jgi:cyclohexyl-isocyanide hydratase
VVADGNVFTGGGVTAGIDVALAVAAEIAGRATAEAIQLGIEYNPAPPFNSGSPDTAPAETVARVRERIAQNQIIRGQAITRAAARLSESVSAKKR